jgi:signal transduction histidine kinase
MPQGIRTEWTRFPVGTPVPLAEVALGSEPMFLESRDAWLSRYPAMAPLLEATGHHANAVVPLIVEGRVLGAFGAAFDAPQEFGDDERSLALAVAQQCAQAMERARLFEAERKARRDAELAMQAAEAANRAKGEFLATMSHELRTPLNAIAGHAQLIEMGLHGPVTEGQREALRRIELAQRHLLGLVNDVLNFARLQAGRVEYEVRPVQLAEVVGALDPLIGPQLQAKGLGYTVDAPDDIFVRADRDKLIQVLLNLLSNAVKFTPSGGKVHVECARRSDGTGDPDTVFLRVSDTGVGIPRDKLVEIFDPFIQVDMSATGRKGGTGLGLAISRDLTRGMGGDLRVRSTVGGGTTFTVALPRSEPVEPGQASRR